MEAVKLGVTNVDPTLIGTMAFEPAYHFITELPLAFKVNVVFAHPLSPEAFALLGALTTI